jgi:hypothetical protein
MSYVKKSMRTWFEIARFPHRLEKKNNVFDISKLEKFRKAQLEFRLILSILMPDLGFNIYFRRARHLLCRD